MGDKGQNISLEPLRVAEIQHFPHCTTILHWPFFTMRKNAHAHATPWPRKATLYTPKVCTSVLFILITC